MFKLRLPGLPARNLASHLALLGVMKILEEDMPDWKSHGYWKKRGADWSPVLSLAAEKTEDELCEVLAQGLHQRASVYRSALEQLTPDGLLAEIGADGFAQAVRDLSQSGRLAEMSFVCALSAGLEEKKDNKYKLSFSPLLLLEGQIKKTSTLTDNKEGKKKSEKKGYDHDLWSGSERSVEKIKNTLFGDGFWKRNDNVLKFYWDYSEWVEQEREGRDTSKEKNKVEWAASALAQVGFSGLGAFPVLIDGKLWTKAPGWIRKDSLDSLRFPLWVMPVTYDTIQELLLSKMLSGGNRGQLEQIGVKQVVNVEIFSGAKGRKATRYGRFLW